MHSYIYILIVLPCVIKKVHLLSAKACYLSTYLYLTSCLKNLKNDTVFYIDDGI